MKWLLRAVGTNYFVKADGTFTKDVNEAYELPNIKAAVELCDKRKLIGMEVVLRLGSSVEATIQMGDAC